MSLTIDDFGDFERWARLRTIDATGMTVVPLTDENDCCSPGRWRSAGVEGDDRIDDCRRSAGADCDSEAGGGAGQFVVETCCAEVAVAAQFVCAPSRR